MLVNPRRAWRDESRLDRRRGGDRSKGTPLTRNAPGDAAGAASDLPTFPNTRLRAPSFVYRFFCTSLPSTLLVATAVPHLDSIQLSLHCLFSQDGRPQRHLSAIAHDGPL